MLRMLKKSRKYDGKQLTVSGEILTWSEVSLLCGDDESKNLKLEDKCLGLSFAESMYFKFNTKDGRPAERIKGNHSGKYVSVAGCFIKTAIPTEKEKYLKSARTYRGIIRGSLIQFLKFPLGLF